MLKPVLARFLLSDLRTLKRAAILGFTVCSGLWGEHFVSAAESSSPVPNGIILQAVSESKALRDGKTIALETGMLIYPGDRLQTAIGDSVLVQCNDLTLQAIAAGSTWNNNCPFESEPKCPEDAIKCPHRGEPRQVNPFIPYIIHPRRTALLNPRPLLQWNPLAEASIYTVVVRGEGVEWTTETDRTQIVYSGEIPLQPEGHYFFIVTADTGQSSRQEPPQLGGMGFWLLDESTAQRVREKEAHILQTVPEGTANTLAIAHLYLKHGLISEGISRLEEWIALGGRSASVHRLLGDLYANHLLLDIQARQHYERAETLEQSL
ncbi:MAG: hypothetical protein J7647_02050 [Cyanobacteria bacterium SBLK]|nr:hypothetical protein [Cyanobacteria bacterium SBLK]